MTAPRKFKNSAFDEMAARSGCTEPARAWMKAALDPFHDFDIAVTGIPDNDSQHSVVQVVPHVLTLRAPDNLEVGETWSAHICSLPIGNTVPVNSWNQLNAVDTIKRTGETESQAGVLGTVTVISHGDNPGVDAPNSSFPAHSEFPGGNPADYGNVKRTFQAVSPDDDNTTSMKKVIAGGFEVHNDTPELYKGGSVTVYQTPQSSTNGWEEIDDAFLTSSRATSQICRQPPANRDRAVATPSSRTWEAKDGCYVPLRLGDDTHYGTAAPRRFQTSDLDNSLQIPGQPINMGYVQTPSTETGFLSGTLAIRPLDIETTGAYFSGLSQETVLTLTVKFLMEVAPTTANKQLLYSASPTPLYCPRALETYHQIVRDLPPGVKVDYNDKGDWFRMVTKAMADTAMALAPAVAGINPGAGAVVGGIGTAARFANTLAQNKSRTSKAVGKPVSRPNRA